MADTLANVRPLRTADRVIFELRRHVDPVQYKWTPTRAVGEGLAAVVSAIGRIDMRNIRRIEDSDAQADEMLKVARAEVYYRGELVPEGIDSLPEVHFYSLAGLVSTLSAIGVDPFAEAPAGS